MILHIHSDTLTFISFKFPPGFEIYISSKHSFLFELYDTNISFQLQAKEILPFNYL